MIIITVSFFGRYNGFLSNTALRVNGVSLKKVCESSISHLKLRQGSVDIHEHLEIWVLVWFGTRPENKLTWKKIPPKQGSDCEKQTVRWTACSAFWSIARLLEASNPKRHTSAPQWLFPSSASFTLLSSFCQALKSSDLGNISAALFTLHQRVSSTHNC